MSVAAILNWLARYARVLLAGGVFIGLLLPDLAALLRPLLAPAVIGTLTAALLRLDWRRLHAGLRRPRALLWLCLWQLVASPLLVWWLVALFGLSPALGLSLILQAAAPPIGSAAVFALLLGIDATLTLLVAVVTVLLLPVTLTTLLAVLPDAAVTVDLPVFFVRVTLFVGAPFMIAALLRRLIGVERLAANDDLLAALNVLLLVIFAIAVMDGVSVYAWHNPAAAGALLLAALLAALLLHAVAYGVFAGAGAGADSALSAALCSGNRNMGLMLAVTAGSAGPTFSLYVGLAQIPMYFAPLLLAALRRR